jgi:hypothetical protein
MLSDASEERIKNSTGVKGVVLWRAYPEERAGLFRPRAVLCYGSRREKAGVISARCDFPPCVESELHHKG